MLLPTPLNRLPSALKLVHDSHVPAFSLLLAQQFCAVTMHLKDSRGMLLLQVLEEERQQLRLAAMDVADYKAQQQASLLEEQQKSQALQQQVQQSEARERQQHQELLQLREQVAALQHQHQQQATDQNQLSAALREALDQKQV